MNARIHRFAALVAATLVVGCQKTTPAASITTGADDIVSSTRRSDGRYDVVCRDGSREVVTAEQIRSDQVCQGGAAECFVENGTFHVVSGGREYTQRVDQDLSSPRVSCGTDVAAVYDGDYLHVFDHTRKRFNYAMVDDGYEDALLSTDGGVAALYDGDYLHVYDTSTGAFNYAFVDDAYADARLVTTSSLVALYDGDYLHIYDATTRSFTYAFVDDAYPDVQLAAEDRLVALYDGDYLHVYDGDAKSFTYAFVDDAAPHATLLLASRGLLFYDDDYVHSWCQGSRAFDYEFAPDNVAAVRTTRRDAELLMSVGTSTFRLDLGTCELTSR